MTYETKRPAAGNRNTVLIAGMIVQFFAGVIYMWSVFKGPVVEHLQWDAAAAAMTASIMLVMFVMGMLAGGILLDRYGQRKVAVAGSLVMSLGILSSSFVTSAFPEMIYLTYGVLGGLGIGMVYTCTVSVVQKWFFDKRGFATGMMVGAFGFSLVVFTPVANYLLESVGVASTFLIFGVAFLAVCTSLSFFLAPPPADYCVGSGKVSVKASQKQYTVREMLRTRSFYLITLSLFLVLSAYFILNPQFVTLGEARGLTHDMALVGVMLAGVFSALGRLTVAWVSDRIGRIPAMLMIALLTAAGITVMIFAEGMVFLACIAVISYAFGGASGIYATVVADRFGTENMGTNYGIVMMGFGASALVFPRVSNGLSGGGDYTSSFIMVALTCLAALVCILLLSRERDQPGPA
jgi:OFA family oxalate/formate antiporter-like MFS transporter